MVAKLNASSTEIKTLKQKVDTLQLELNQQQQKVTPPSRSSSKPVDPEGDIDPHCFLC